MDNVLITGATGNVGFSVLKALSLEQHHLHILAGVRNPEKDGELLKNLNCSVIQFDFDDIETQKRALEGVKILFLMRPPRLADVPKYFEPLINIAVEKNVSHIIFLSVQGADKMTIIPHHKIENIILNSRIHYTFLRPAYFMQNFTTTLKEDVAKSLIYLPAGKAKFTLVDVDDVGMVAVKVILSPDKYLNQSFDLTSSDLLSFKEMTEILNKCLNKKIIYVSPNLIQFFLRKRKEKAPISFILVMIMLHYLPRLKKAPLLSNNVKKITGRDPHTFVEFIDLKKSLFN